MRKESKRFKLERWHAASMRRIYIHIYIYICDGMRLACGAPAGGPLLQTGTLLLLLLLVGPKVAAPKWPQVVWVQI